MCLLLIMSKLHDKGLGRGDTFTGRKSSSVVPVASLWASLSSKWRDSNLSSSAATQLLSAYKTDCTRLFTAYPFSAYCLKKLYWQAQGPCSAELIPKTSGRLFPVINNRNSGVETGPTLDFGE